MSVYFVLGALHYLDVTRCICVLLGNHYLVTATGHYEKKTMSYSCEITGRTSLNLVVHDINSCHFFLLLEAEMSVKL